MVLMAVCIRYMEWCAYIVLMIFLRTRMVMQVRTYLASFLRLAHAWNLVKFLYCATVMHGDKYILSYVQCKFIEAGHFIGGSSSKPISLGKTDSSDEDEDADLQMVRIQCN